MTRTRNPNADPARVAAVKDRPVRRVVAAYRALHGEGLRAGPGTSPLLADTHLSQAAHALNRAVAYFGSIAAASKAILAPVSSTATWVVTPPHRVLALAAATGYQVTPHELRPDLYPFPEDGCPREMRVDIIRRHNERAAGRERVRADVAPSTVTEPAKSA